MSEELSSNPLEEVDSLLGIEPSETNEDNESKQDAPEDKPEQEEESKPDQELETEEELDADQETEEETEEENVPNIDYDQEIPMPDGREAVTLGALKDRVIELERTEEHIINRENDLMTQARELKHSIELAGGEIPLQLKEQMQARQQAHLQRENDAMFEAIPAWKDPAVFESDRKGIVSLGAQYGMTANEMSQIMDHRMIKFLHDHNRLLKAQQTGQDNIKRLSAVPTKKSRNVRAKSKQSSLNQQIDQASASSNADVKHAAVSALLGS